MMIPNFKLERYFAVREFETPYMLSGSDCETLTVGELLELEDLALEKFQQLGLAYTETKGSTALRHEIAQTYEKIEPDEILVHAGGEEAIFTLYHSLLNRGDHVVVHRPSYQSLHEIPRSLGCEVTRWNANPENGWKLDLDFLDDVLHPQTKLVVVNSPHNPTGMHFSQTEWRELIEIIERNDTMLLADEAYRGLEYREKDRLPAACDLSEHAVSLGLVSKGYGLPGLRLGWLASKNKKLLDRIEAFKDYTTICTAAPSEFLSEVAVRNRETLLKRGREIVTGNLPSLQSFFERHRDFFSWTAPKAGSVCYPTLQKDDVDSFCERLMRVAEVILLPGTVFEEASRECRFGFGRTNFPESLERLENFLKKESS